MLWALKSWGFAEVCDHSRQRKAFVVVLSLHQEPRKMLVVMQMVKKQRQREQDETIATGEPF